MIANRKEQYMMDTKQDNLVRVAIVEDELPAARLLKSMILSLRPDWDVVHIGGSNEEAASSEYGLLRKKPDSAFRWYTAMAPVPSQNEQPPCPSALRFGQEKPPSMPIL